MLASLCCHAPALTEVRSSVSHRKCCGASSPLKCRLRVQSLMFTFFLSILSAFRLQALGTARILVDCFFGHTRITFAFELVGTFSFFTLSDLLPLYCIENFLLLTFRAWHSTSVVTPKLATIGKMRSSCKGRGTASMSAILSRRWYRGEWYGGSTYVVGLATRRCVFYHRKNDAPLIPSRLSPKT